MTWEDDDTDPAQVALREIREATEMAIISVIQVLLTKTPGVKPMLEELGPSTAKRFLETGEWGPEGVKAYATLMKSFTDMAK